MISFRNFKNLTITFGLGILVLGLTASAGEHADPCPKNAGARIIARNGKTLTLTPTSYRVDPVTLECEYFTFQFAIEDPKNDSKSITYIGKEISVQDLERAGLRIKDRLQSAYEMKKWDADIDEISYLLAGWALITSHTTGGLIWRGAAAFIGIVGFTLWVDIGRFLVKGTFVLTEHGVLAVTAKPVTRRQQRLFQAAFDGQNANRDIQVSNRMFRRLVDRISK